MKDGVVSADGWAFASSDRTTAEVILDLYQTIRDAAGEGIIIGCNTVSHLCAGVFELNRIGDDTSGNDWRRCPQMGVNRWRFGRRREGRFMGRMRIAVRITKKLPWDKRKQWLDLVARSGTPLFVSVDRSVVTPEIKEALRARR